MSVQFGRWNFDGRPVDREYLAKAEAMLAPYGPDGGGTYIKDSTGILFRAFHTTKEARKEQQPKVLASGEVFTWDGRLDNREELLRGVKRGLPEEPTDLDIATAAYEEWGTASFAKLLGDWALAIWNPSDRSVLLAKDFVGIRHLFYTAEKDSITWSTILDPLVLLAGRTFALEEEYIAGWLAFFPATHLTPYVGIHSVPPSCFVRLGPKGETVHKDVQKYWDFDPKKRIRYRTDAAYEEHFRQVFGESVKRRLRSDSPVLAELSGGMDSSSIVCMADEIIARGEAETPRLDTVSYYNDAEPNWNERPYFATVESRRCRTGRHINVESREPLRLDGRADEFPATPGSGGIPAESTKQFLAYVASGYRIVLCGIGGDEVTGGVPNPVPILTDQLVTLRIKGLTHCLATWALAKRKPLLRLLFEVVSGFLPEATRRVPEPQKLAEWLQRSFIESNRAALSGYRSRLHLFGPLPSFQIRSSTFAALQRQLACSVLPGSPAYEKGYPFLDRSLLEFLSSIPSEQLVRPGQRRSLMRRALCGIVPTEILNRKRKAYVARAPMTAILAGSSQLCELSKHMVSSSLGIVEPEIFLQALQKAWRGLDVPTVFLVRTVAIERWLRAVSERNVLCSVVRNRVDVPARTSRLVALRRELPERAIKSPAAKEFSSSRAE